MTRDPYIMTIAAVMLQVGLSEESKVALVKKIKIPFYLNRPSLWRWKRAVADPHNRKLREKYEKSEMRGMRFAIKTGRLREKWKVKEKYYKALGPEWKYKVYHFLRHNAVAGYPGFVKHLDGWKVYVAKATEAQEMLAKEIPYWNTALKLLCRIPTAYLLEDFVKAYEPKRGYQWQGEAWVKKEILVDQDYYLDKGVLDWLWTKYIEDGKK